MLSFRKGKKDKKNKKKNQAEITEGPRQEIEIEDREYTLNFPSLVENMKNDGVFFEKDHFIMQTGLGNVKYGRSFYLKPWGYPRTVRVGWLDSLYQGDDLDVSVYVDPIGRNEAIKSLQKKIDELESVFYQAQKNGDVNRMDDVSDRRAEAKALQREIKENVNGLNYVTVVASVYADSLEELNSKSVALESELGGESIEILNCFANQKEGFLTTLPLGKNFLKERLGDVDRNLDQRALTAIFPHSSSQLNHTGGIPIGISGNEYVYFNNFDAKLNNYGVAVFGESGAGKGVFIKQIVGRGPADGIHRQLIIDVESEYGGLTQALGGIVIPLRSGKIKPGEKRVMLNPFDVYPEQEILNRGSKDEKVIYKNNITEKVKEAIELVRVMKLSAAGTNMLTPIEMGEINDIFEELYEGYGITEHPESIYETVEEFSPNGEIRWAKVLKPMPTITDLYQALIKKSETVDGLQDIVQIVKLFTAGKTFGMFDGQTYLGDAVSSLDTAPIITFDISSIPKKSFELPLAQHIINIFAWNRFVKQDLKTKKRILIDEAQYMLDYGSMIDFWNLLALRGRKYNVSLTLVAQRYEAFYRNELARDIVAQLNTVAFMKQAPEDIAPILDTFKLSADVGTMIRTAMRGQVILKCGREIVAFRSEPTPGEWPYLNTNQNMSFDNGSSNNGGNLSAAMEQLHRLEEEQEGAGAHASNR